MPGNLRISQHQADEGVIDGGLDEGVIADEEEGRLAVWWKLTAAR